MRTEARRGALCVQRHPALIGPTRARGLPRNRAKIQRIELASVGASGERFAVAPLDRIYRDVPDLPARFKLLHHLFGDLSGRHAGGEGDAGTSGDICEADRRRIRNHSANRPCRNAQHPGHHYTDGGSRAADVRTAICRGDRSILVDLNLRRRWTRRAWRRSSSRQWHRMWGRCRETRPPP